MRTSVSSTVAEFDRLVAQIAEDSRLKTGWTRLPAIRVSASDHWRALLEAISRYLDEGMALKEP